MPKYLNEKCYNFQKIKKIEYQIFWIFNCNRNILPRLWVNVLLSQEWVQAEVAVNLYMVFQCLSCT